MPNKNKINKTFPFPAYHVKCIDPWLTKNKKTCPVCKRRVIPGKDHSDDSDDSDDDSADYPTEATPLLGGGAAAAASSRASTFNTDSAAFTSSGRHSVSSLSLSLSLTLCLSLSLSRLSLSLLLCPCTTSHSLFPFDWSLSTYFLSFSLSFHVVR